MIFALLLLPTLLMADTEVPANVTLTPATTLTATGEVPSAPMATPATGTIELRLKQNFEAPAVLAVSEGDIKDPLSVGKDAAGVEWFTTEREVTLDGYVDNASITKDLDVVKDAKVWTTPELKELLTVVGDPASARLLDADKGVGHVQVKEPRVLYFAKQAAPVAATVEVASAATETTVISTPVSDEAAAKVEVAPATSATVNVAAPEYSAVGMRRAIEGQLVKGGFLTGGRYSLVDENGGRICKVAKDSPIDSATFDKYRNKVVVLVGDLGEKGGDLTLKVRSIKMR